MHLSSTYIHPIKSCAGLIRPYLDILPRGPAEDRRWMIVDSDRRFLSARTLPALVSIRAEPTATGLMLRAPGMAPLPVSRPRSTAERMPVRVWEDEVDAACADPQADAWLSRFLARPVRLVHMDERAQRPIRHPRAAPGDEVSFADGFPLLLIGDAALDALNARLPRPVPMTRFRPNLTIADCPPHAEDRWLRLRIGRIEFVVGKPCTRCVLTTVDPDTGSFDAEGEPLNTLKRYRRTDAGVTFGVNLLPRGTGRIAVGDPVTVLETA